MSFSSISMDIPTYQINDNELQNLMGFIYKHEHILKEFGAIKIQLNNDCKLGLYKRPKKCDFDPINQQIVKSNENQLIYLVENVNYIDKSNQENCLINDENSFWSSLSCSKTNRCSLNISTLENKSFFCQKLSRSYFDLNRFPKESILKLGGKNFVSQFVPYVRRSHGPASIFPLNCVKQNLFSINYHHQGGSHYYYFIPNNQKYILQKLINQFNPSICLDHGQIFLNPQFLDKYQIRYYKTIQQQNEFVVLSSGTLSEYFSSDQSWTESIDFAFPTWIEDQLSNSSQFLCQCNIHLYSLKEYINQNLFTHQIIQQYIQNNLLTNRDNNSINTNSIQTSNSDSNNSSNGIDTFNQLIFKYISSVNQLFETILYLYLYLDETNPTRNIKLIIPLKRVLPSFQSSPTSSIIPSINNDFDEDDNHLPIKYQIFENENLVDVSHHTTPDKRSLSSSYPSDIDQDMMELYQTTSTFSDIDQNLPLDFDEETYFLSFDQLMDLIPFNDDTFGSTYIHTKNSSTCSSNEDKIVFNEECYVEENQFVNQKINRNRTLFVSGLKSDVNPNDIRHHFIGSIKLTIKMYRSTPNLKYAFVLHRTPREAELNMQRPIDYHRFGHRCRVEYAEQYSDTTNNQEMVDQQKVVVTRIPENVTENDLHHLFPDGHILRYCPARLEYSKTKTMETKNNQRSLLGYAFIRYDNKQQTAYVIKHADQYQINGQQLSISLYRNRISNHTTTRELFTH